MRKPINKLKVNIGPIHNFDFIPIWDPTVGEEERVTVSKLREQILTGLTFTHDITRVAGGTNISTGGTGNFPIINLDDDITLNSITSDFISGSSISINGGEIMTRIPDSEDFQLFGNQSSTGVIEHLGLSANTIDNSKFDLGPVKGWIIDNTTDPTQPVVTYVDYSGSTVDNPSGITLSYLVTNPVTYIGITGETTADIVQSTSPFLESNHRDTLVLGVVIHSNNTSINAVNDLPALAIDPTAQYYDLIMSLGFFNVDAAGLGGNIYGPNDGNLKIDKSFGKIFAHSANYTNDPKNPHVKDMVSGASITFRYRLQDSTEYSNTTDIDPNNYDNNGVLTVVPQNKFTVQRVTLFTSNITRIQYGQNIYDSIDDAEASLSTEDFEVESNISENGLLRAFIITKEGSVSLSDPKNSKFISANNFGHANDTVVGNVHRTEIVNHSSTGLRVGGIISADSPTTFKVSAGSGLIIDNSTNPNNPTHSEVAWGDITGNTLTYLTGSVLTAIMINLSGETVQFPLESPPTQSDKRNKILLGGIAHSDLSSITNIYNSPLHTVSPVNQHEDLTTSVGPFSVDGNIISGVAGSLELVKTDGDSYFYGGNFQQDNTNPSIISTDLISGSTTPSSPLVYASGAGIIGISGYTIDVTNYDPNGSGSIIPITGNRYVPHRIWHLPINNLLVFQYGQYEYTSLNNAINSFSTENYLEPPGLRIGAYLISVVIAKKTTTDLTDTSTTKFIQQGKFASTGGGGGAVSDTLQTVYDNSTQPEIITDATRTAVDFRVGSGADTDNVITFQNSTGGTTAWVQGDGDASFNDLTVNSISASTIYSGGTELHDIFVTTDTVVTGLTFNSTTYDLTVGQDNGNPSYTSNLAALASDIFVLSGVYDISTGIVTYTTNSGATFQVSGFTSGMTDSYTSSANLNGTVVEFNNNIQGTNLYNVDLNPLLSGKTNNTDFWSHTGDTNNPHQTSFSNLTSTGHTHVLSEITDFGPYSGSVQTQIDLLVNQKLDDGINVGGGHEVLSGKSDTDLYFRTLSGGSNTTLTTVGDVIKIDVSLVASENSYVTGSTLNGNTLELGRNGGLSTLTTDLSQFIDDTVDGVVSGATMNGNTLELGRTEGLSNVTVDLSQFIDDTNDGVVSGVTLNGNTLELSRTEGLSTLTTDLSQFLDNTDNYVSGGTYSNGTLLFSGTSSNQSFSVDVSGLLDDTNFYVTGGTVSGTDLILGRNGGLSDVTIDTSNYFDDTDNYVTGATMNSNTLELSRSGGLSDVTVDLSQFIDDTVDGVVSGATLNGNTLELSRTEGLSLVSVDLSQFIDDTNDGVLSGATMNGNTLELGRTEGLSDVTVDLSQFLDNTDDITRVAGGTNINTGGTGNSPIINLDDDITLNSVDATTFYSGGTELSTLFALAGSNTNNYVTGFTYNNTNTLTVSLNDGNDYSATIDEMSGLTINGDLAVNGQSVFSGTTDVVHIYGSGDVEPTFLVEGSSGELFAVTDSLVGTLFSVNDISGLPILEVVDDSTILMGSYLAPALHSSNKVTANSGTTVGYTLPSSGYTSAFFDYSVYGTTGARAGSISAIWSGSSVEYNEVTTNDIGDTSDVTMFVDTTLNVASLKISTNTDSWTVKTIVKSI